MLGPHVGAGDITSIETNMLRAGPPQIGPGGFGDGLLGSLKPRTVCSPLSVSGVVVSAMLSREKLNLREWLAVCRSKEEG